MFNFDRLGNFVKIFHRHFCQKSRTTSGVIRGTYRADSDLLEISNCAYTLGPLLTPFRRKYVEGFVIHYSGENPSRGVSGRARQNILLSAHARI